ncbi:MAG: GldG family protein, partial [Defluviitaleaceae bacterium]|nr:GldG family protein [Defluviitaleaceae bacterium]
MGGFLNSLKDKKFRYGTFSTVMMMIAVAVFILINLVAGRINASYDLTSDKMFSLSKYSRDFVRGLEQDVTIYGLFPTGGENVMIKQLMEEYASLSSRISIEYRDPVLYPAFVEQYARIDERVSNNSVIVVSGD